MDKGEKVPVSVLLTKQQIAKLAAAIASHPDIKTRGGYLEAVLDGKVDVITNVQEDAGVSTSGVTFYMSTEHHSLITSEANVLKLPVAATIRQTLFGVARPKRRRSEPHTIVRIGVRIEQREALNRAAANHSSLRTYGEYLLAVLDGLAPAIECSMNASKGSTTVLSPRLPTRRYLELRDLARQEKQSIASFLHARLFTQPRFARAPAKVPLFIDLRLREYENAAVREMIASYPSIDSFGELVSALRAGENIEVIQPVPSESWKTTNTRIYLPADEFEDLRNDLKASQDTNTAYLLQLIFGSEYRRTSSKAGPRKPYTKRTTQAA